MKLVCVTLHFTHSAVFDKFDAVILQTPLHIFLFNVSILTYSKTVCAVTHSLSNLHLNGKGTLASELPHLRHENAENSILFILTYLKLCLARGIPQWHSYCVKRYQPKTEESIFTPDPSLNLVCKKENIPWNKWDYCPPLRNVIFWKRPLISPWLWHVCDRD